MGVPSGTPLPGTLRGLSILVPQADAVAAYVRRKGAIPIRAEIPSHVDRPVAAPAWQLEAMGFTKTKFVLLKKKHALAVPPGENGWLKQLDEYLQQQKSRVEILLKQEAQP